MHHVRSLGCIQAVVYLPHNKSPGPYKSVRTREALSARVLCHKIRQCGCTLSSTRPRSPSSPSFGPLPKLCVTNVTNREAKNFFWAFFSPFSPIFLSFYPLVAAAAAKICESFSSLGHYLFGRILFLCRVLEADLAKVLRSSSGWEALLFGQMKADLLGPPLSSCFGGGGDGSEDGGLVPSLFLKDKGQQQLSNSGRAEKKHNLWWRPSGHVREMRDWWNSPNSLTITTTELIIGIDSRRPRLVRRPPLISSLTFPCCCPPDKMFA